MNFLLFLRWIVWHGFLALVAVGSVWAAALDTLTLGQETSEQAHGLRTERSETITGGLGETARQLLPPGTPGIEGGRLDFVLKVDPAKPTYLTARFWGSDRTEGQLVLFCEGKQVGYRHLGDVDVLNIANGSPGCPGRFFYVTTPLPEALTKGKTELHLQIRSYGRLYGYGTTFEQYQKPMTAPSRGIYRLYTHTETCFVPPPEELQGRAEPHPPTRQEPGEEVLAQVQAREIKEVADLLKRPTLDQHQLWYLARAYHQRYTPAFHRAEVAQKAAEALDAIFADYQRDPETAHIGKAIYNPDWFGLGPAANALVLLAKPIKPLLDSETAPGNGLKRRAAWARMFADCRDWHLARRRQYTNQSMINDTYGVYLPNRAVALLEPARALPEDKARRYLYESAGLEPWLGSEKDGVPQRPLGEHYLQLTSKGLTKELGFVGYYGEVLDWLRAMCEATAPAPGEPGDARLRAQLIKVARARAPFRYPAVDNDGFRAMRAEAVVGWRDGDHYPGDVVYTQRPTWDDTALGCAAATLDPVLLGGAQQMLADHQFFATLQEQAKVGNLRGTAGLLEAPEQYELLRRQPASDARLPMSPGTGDFVFSDEEDGVVAVKHGDEILYASLYWRARNAVNFLARVHYILPAFERIAVVREETRFTPSGLIYKRPDWVNMGFGNGGIPYPGNLHSALAGEELPIARIPAGTDYRSGDENVDAGRGDFYVLRYGPYLIGMNTTTDQTFGLPVPTGEGAVTDLSEKKEKAGPDGSRPVGPRSTAVLYVGGDAVQTKRG